MSRGNHWISFVFGRQLFTRTVYTHLDRLFSTWTAAERHFSLETITACGVTSITFYRERTAYTRNEYGVNDKREVERKIMQPMFWIFGNEMRIINGRRRRRRQTMPKLLNFEFIFFSIRFLSCVLFSDYTQFEWRESKKYRTNGSHKFIP